MPSFSGTPSRLRQGTIRLSVEPLDQLAIQSQPRGLTAEATVA